MLLPVGVWLLILFAIVMAVVLRYTRLGRHTFAIGSSEQTARLCGVPVERVKVIIFMLGGMFAGLAGLMQFCGREPASLRWPLAVLGALN